MEMVLNNGFCELANDEIMLTEGGFDFVDIAGSAICGYAGGKVGAAIGGPIGGVVGGLVGVVAFEIVYHLNN